MDDPQAGDADADNDSGIENDEWETDTIASYVARPIWENGRSYQSLKPGRYPLPNDGEEQNRLDLQHHLFTVTLGRLSACPTAAEGKTVHRVLDVGTGTGIWAIEFGDEHPEAEVIGIDLSPIQPEFVPANVTFYVDDLEAEWDFCHPFHFIHIRGMIPAILSWKRLLKQSFDHMVPGGSIEVIDVSLRAEADDESTRGTEIKRWSDIFERACTRAGIPTENARNHKQQVRDAGFEDVVETVYRWPLNTWPKDKKDKILGAWTCLNFGDNISGLSMALLTREGWSKQQIEIFSAIVKKDFRNPRIHAYFNVYVVCGKKPKNQQEV